MLTFYGFDLELFVEEVLDRGNWPTLCCARDFRGGQWLIVQVDDDPDSLAWMCAPVSQRAIRAVRDGYCAPADVLCHSATGTVELVTVEHGRAVPDRCLLGECVSEQLSTSADRLLGVAA
jgi:hypothetical protein